MLDFKIEVYIIFFILISIVFIVIRVLLLTYRIKDCAIKTSNIQNLGDREYQSNYFSIINKSNITFVALADGIVDTKNGRLAAILTVDILKINFFKKNFNSFSQFLELSKELVQKSLRDNIISSNNLRVHLTAIKIENNILYYFNDGNTIIIYRNKELTYLERSSKFRLNPKDVIIIASSGVIKNLKEVYIHWYLGLTDLSLKEKGFQLQKKALEVLKSQNSTIILLEVPTKNLVWEKKV